MNNWPVHECVIYKQVVVDGYLKTKVHAKKICPTEKLCREFENQCKQELGETYCGSRYRIS